MAQEYLIALGSNLGSHLGSGVSGTDVSGTEGGTARTTAQTVAAALHALASRGLTLRRVSRFYATPCFPAGAGPDYVNACVVLRDDRSEPETDPLSGPDQEKAGPHGFLKVLHEVEAEFGREREQRWGSRTLDLDLIAAGACVLPDEATQAQWRGLAMEDQTELTPDRLILPHPRLQDRAFVLVPLADVAPDWRHPLLGRTVSEMCRALPAALRQEVLPL